MTFPGGKFVGVPLAEVPSAYLVWCLENGYWRNYSSALKAELQLRLGIHAAPSALSSRPVVPPGLQDTAADLIEAGFRSLALKRHPDQGGDGLAMRQLIETRSLLKQVVSHG